MQHIYYYVETYNHVSNPRARFNVVDSEGIPAYLVSKALNGTTKDDPYIYIELNSNNEKGIPMKKIGEAIFSLLSNSGCHKVERYHRETANEKIFIIKAVADTKEK